MPVIACKLPHGLTVIHNSQKLALVGGNIGEDLENVSRNGRPNDNSRRAGGFGLTVLNDAGAALFSSWAAAVTYKGGQKANGKLAEPYAAIENGSILGPFADEAEAIRECGALSGSIVTGTEGLDPEAEQKKGGVEPDKESGKVVA